MRVRSASTAALVAALALAGCGGGEAPGEQAGGRASPRPSITAQDTDVRLPPSEPLRFRAADGEPLEGTFTPGPGRRAAAVVLSHEVRGGPDQFDPLIPVLHGAGYATLAYMSRSEGGGLDETLLARDIAGAVRALRRRSDVRRDRLGLIGASIGGSAAAWAIATKDLPGVRAAVGLSAVEDPR